MRYRPLTGLSLDVFVPPPRPIRFYAGHPETCLRQAAVAVLIRIATAAMNGPAGIVPISLSGSGVSSPLAEQGSSPPATCDVCGNQYPSARIVISALVCAYSERRALRRAAEQGADPKGGRGGGGGGRQGSAVTLSWEFREATLLVYEGVLKQMVEGRLAEAFFGNDGGNRPPPPLHATVATSSLNSVATLIGTADGRTSAGAAEAAAEDSRTSTAHDVSGSGDKGFVRGWPARLLRSTPPLSELLVSVVRQAEAALNEAERGRSAGHPQHQPARGSVELWRTGSQLVSTVGRAMVWWNPRAIHW